MLTRELEGERRVIAELLPVHMSHCHSLAEVYQHKDISHLCPCQMLLTVVVPRLPLSLAPFSSSYWLLSHIWPFHTLHGHNQSPWFEQAFLKALLVTVS